MEQIIFYFAAIEQVGPDGHDSTLRVNLAKKPC
jgi:hypothetical protein